MQPSTLLLFLLAFLLSCSSLRPYSCGPALDQPTVEKTFGPIVDFMGVKPGSAFADVGASSGYYTVMMATLMKHVTIYIQDIDTACLNKREVDKVIDYYSRQSRLPLLELNDIRFVAGTIYATGLPENFFDHIYTNGTFHHFANPDKMMSDLYAKLKYTGELTIRDSFTTKDEEYCGDKVRTRLQPIDTLLAVMNRNGFELVERKDFAPYPAFKFRKK